MPINKLQRKYSLTFVKEYGNQQKMMSPYMCLNPSLMPIFRASSNFSSKVANGHSSLTSSNASKINSI